MRLASIHTYPVKGLHRIDRDAARVQPWGLAGDRRYLLIDGDGRMLTQRQEPRLTQLRPSYVDGRLVVRTVGRSDLDVAPAPGELIEVEVWRTRVPASLVGEAADRWLSEALDRKVRLVYLDDPTRRPVDPDYGTAADRVSFADAYRAFAVRLAEQPPINIAMIKRAAQQSVHTDLRTALDLISSHLAVVHGTSDSREARSALRERRRPSFQGS